MKISIESFNRIETAVHPNIRKQIEKFKQEEYYVFPNYHGYNKKN